MKNRIAFLAMVLMAGIAIAAIPFSKGGGVFVGGYPASVSAQENSDAVYVSPSDAQRLQAIYDAAVTKWNLAAGEWGVIYFYPGTYDMGSTNLVMHQSRVRLIGLGSTPYGVALKPSATSATGNDGLIEITAYLAGIENMTIMTNDYSGSAIFMNNTRTGTATLTGTSGNRTVTLTGIGVDCSKGDYIYAYAAADSGGGWAQVTTVTSDNAIKTTGFGNGTYTVELVSMVNSEYRNLNLLNANTASIDETASGLHYVKDLGGRWYNTTLSSSSGMNRDGGAGWDIVGLFDGIYAPSATKIFGMDNGNYQFNGIARNFNTGAQFIGCGVWSSDVGPQAIIENGSCGTYSICVGRKIHAGAIIRNVRASSDSFCAPGGGGITTANGAGNSEAITFTAADVNNDKLYGPTRGRPGLTVYLTGTNVTDGYYSVSSVVEETGVVTFTTNPCTGATTDCQMQWAIGEIDGTLIDCYATDSDSFASLGDTSPHSWGRSAYLQRCYVASVDITAIPLGNDTDGAITLTVAQSGMTFTNAGDTDAMTVTLPAATVGLEYTFWDVVNTAAVDLTIDGNASEEIGALSTGAVADNDAIQHIHIKCVVAGAWAIVESSGTWD